MSNKPTVLNGYPGRPAQVVKRYRYFEQGDNGEPVAVVKTEREIIETYYPWWRLRMKSKGFPACVITKEKCVEEYVVVHWAEEVQEAKETEVQG